MRYSRKEKPEVPKCQMLAANILNCPVHLKTHFALHNTLMTTDKKSQGNARVALQVGAMKGNLKSIPVKYVHVLYIKQILYFYL